MHLDAGGRDLDGERSRAFDVLVTVGSVLTDWLRANHFQSSAAPSTTPLAFETFRTRRGVFVITRSCLLHRRWCLPLKDPDNSTRMHHAHDERVEEICDILSRVRPWRRVGRRVPKRRAYRFLAIGPLHLHLEQALGCLRMMQSRACSITGYTSTKVIPCNALPSRSKDDGQRQRFDVIVCNVEANVMLYSWYSWAFQ